MHFDCNPPTLFELNSRLRNDPRILRRAELKTSGLTVQGYGAPYGGRSARGHRDSAARR